jgi:hypothetical protein
MHFCADEAMAIAMALPFLGVAFRWLRDRVRRLRLG